MHIGVAGVGRIGSFHARTAAAHPGVAATSVFDVDRARAESVAQSCGAHVASSLDTLLSGVDALVIATPTSTHVDLIRRALDAGMPVFCEKPIALDLAATRAVVDLVETSGATLQIGFQRRFDAGYLRARAMVMDGRLGRLYVVRMAGHDAQPPHESYLPTSGGIFRDLNIHDFDIARFVTGQEITEVYADGAVIGFDFFAHYDDVDTAVTVLRLSDGALGIVSGARHDPLGYDIRMELFGSGDSIAVGLDARVPLRSVEDDGPALSARPWASFVDRFADAYRAELAAFIDVVAGQQQNPCPPADALIAMRVAVACDRSRREHRPVALNEVE
jgi:myo-inositol 2-dehydrogenase/D-chiro-inositol 1-dehydrogenase